MPINWARFGEQIRDHMKRGGILQEDFAKTVGVVQSQISQLMRGEIKKPAYETVQAIKRELGLELLPGEETRPAVAKPPPPKMHRAPLKERPKAKRQ
jgi:transcriptional regulator with XRE-family HTH domain